MSSVREEAEVMSVRLLKWNEKLDNNIHKRYKDRGFFVFFIINEFTINERRVALGTTDKVMLFDLTSLRSPQQIESMVMNMLGLLSTQFLSETITNLGTKISNYLNSNHFHFESDILAKITSHSASPMSVIVVEVCRTRNIVYDQKIMGDAAALFPPQTYSSVCPEYRKLDDFEIEEVIIAITSAIGVSSTCLTRVKPIADDEPRWLVPISAIVALQTISGSEMMEEMMDAMDLCRICLQEYSCGELVVKTPCSHIFHGSCLTRWLSKAHNCPICRFKFPFQ